MRSLLLIVAAAGCALACSKTSTGPLGEADKGGDSGEGTGTAGRAIAGASSTGDEGGGKAGASDITAAAGGAETVARPGPGGDPERERTPVV